jgi:hypothetical protein
MDYNFPDSKKHLSPHLQQIWCNTIGNTCSARCRAAKQPAPFGARRWQRQQDFSSFFKDFQRILEEKAGQARDDRFRWPDRFQGNDCIRMANGPASSYRF